MTRRKNARSANMLAHWNMGSRFKYKARELCKTQIGGVGGTQHSENDEERKKKKKTEDEQTAQKLACAEWEL